MPEGLNPRAGSGAGVGGAAGGRVDGSEPVALIGHARAQVPKRRMAGLTEVERRLLLEEVARIAAELADLQAWTADLARRVTACPPAARERRIA